VVTTAEFNPVGFFRNIPLFATLEARELTEVLRVAEPYTASPGERLFGEGDEPTGLYLIERGEVEVSMRQSDKREVVLAHLGNGSVVGEMSLIDGGPRSASVEVVSPAQGYFLSRSQFEALRARGSPAAYKIIFQLARALEERRRQLESRIQEILSAPGLRERLMEQSTKELIAHDRKA
jgi:CRP-like cAMP-binding protein